jgi:hypothetical protein
MRTQAHAIEVSAIPAHPLQRSGQKLIWTGVAKNIFYGIFTTGLLVVKYRLGDAGKDDREESCIMTNDKPATPYKDGKVLFWAATLGPTLLIAIALVLGLVLAARL